MFASNPFAELSASIPPAVMQTYVVVMIVLVVAGTLFDVVHKGSARYFFENWRRSKAKGAKPLGGGELVSIAVKTGVVDVLTSGEFCNPRRRIAHLLGMYGFVIYVVATALLDRPLHHAVVVQIEGASYRLRAHTDLIPEHTRSHAAITPPPPPKRRGRPPKNGAAHA